MAATRKDMSQKLAAAEKTAADASKAAAAARDRSVTVLLMPE
jgi:hypothetical protein